MRDYAVRRWARRRAQWNGESHTCSGGAGFHDQIDVYPEAELETPSDVIQADARAGVIRVALTPHRPIGQRLLTRR